MSEPIATYLHDHLAGASHAIDLLHWMSEEHKGDALGDFAAGLAGDIAADREVLRGLAERAGAGSSSVIKEMSAWMAEKVSRLKLSDHGATNIGTFESLEFLVLGIHGKLALWHALALIAETDVRFQAADFASLASRAESQEAQVERWRLDVARTTFRPAAS